MSIIVCGLGGSNRCRSMEAPKTIVSSSIDIPVHGTATIGALYHLVERGEERVTATAGRVSRPCDRPI
jgi:hypothetical protein